MKKIENIAEKTRRFEPEIGEKIEKSLIFYFGRIEISPGQVCGFVSLSDIDPLSSNADSVGIPNINDLNWEAVEYLSLNSEFRSRFLYRTHISELDMVYIYVYYSNITQKIEVKKLRVSALLSGYAEQSEEGFSQYDYHIGFEIDAKYFKVNEQEMSDYTFVYVGKENPFVEGEMYPIKWDKISLNESPSI